MDEDFEDAAYNHAPAAAPIAPPVSAITNCRLPPFWRTNPELWFIQAESSFQIHQVTSDSTKYHMTVAVMDAETVAEVADVLQAPPAVGKYADLKHATLQRMTDSADSQLHKLLTGVELGDKNLSQLLREMRTLAKSRAGDDVIRVKWLDLLPPSTQRILRLFKDSKTLEELADAADEINECGPAVMATSRGESAQLPTSAAAMHDQLLQEVAELRAIQQLSTRAHRSPEQRPMHSYSPRRRQSGSRSRTPNNRRMLSQLSLCFHYTAGTIASTETERYVADRHAAIPRLRNQRTLPRETIDADDAYGRRCRRHTTREPPSCLRPHFLHTILGGLGIRRFNYTPSPCKEEPITPTTNSPGRKLVAYRNVRAA